VSTNSVGSRTIPSSILTNIAVNKCDTVPFAASDVSAERLDFFPLFFLSQPAEAAPEQRDETGTTEEEAMQKKVRQQMNAGNDGQAQREELGDSNEHVHCLT
jgi:hypothetical protein